MIRFGHLIFSATVALAATPALAQEQAEKVCIQAGTLPAELAGWGKPHATLTAAAKPADLKTAELTLGTAADAKLQPTPMIKFTIDPSKPGGSVSHGGLFSFTVLAAGTYRVALGSGAWIDVIEDKKAAVSTAHGHGPDCTGVRKMVDYDLKAGRHILQVSANGSPDLTLMVVKLP
jgi:hypothetical protein